MKYSYRGLNVCDVDMNGYLDRLKSRDVALSAIHLIGISPTSGSLRNRAGPVLETPNRRKEPVWSLIPAPGVLYHAVTSTPALTRVVFAIHRALNVHFLNVSMTILKNKESLEATLGGSDYV